MHYPLYPKRTIVNLDGVWEFRLERQKLLEDITLEDFHFDDLMSVPGCFDANNKYKHLRGTALYRTRFRLEENAQDALLKLDGFGLQCRLWLDGRPLGFSKLPYTAIELHTGELAQGDHELIAALDNRLDTHRMKLFLDYYDFYAFGGFYRSVSLHLLPRTAISRVQVRTLDWRSGRVSLDFLFEGDVPSSVKYRFDTETEFHEADPRQTVVATVPAFRVWSPDHPELHTVEARTSDDTILERFGIRQVSTGDGKILLNGEPVYLLGVNRHQSHPEFGVAEPEQLEIEDLQNIQGMNCNFIRGCHYSQGQRFLDACDRMGMLVWEESLGWGNRPDQLADPEFIELQKEQTRLMVRNSINHPSVIIWAFLNEFHSQSQEGHNIARELVKTIRDEDSSRLVTFACNHTQDDISNEFTDIVSVNSYPAWICGDLEERRQDRAPWIHKRFSEIAARFRACQPAGKPMIVSEIGASCLYGYHDDESIQWTEEFQAAFFRDAITEIFAIPDYCGITLWHYCDAKTFVLRAGDIRSKPLAINAAGLFDQYRRPKLATKTVRELFARHHTSVK
ncbi:MAG: hypothetical protein IJS15_05625 [Victivallales bacterium]|nr:hypothetical protein [Victivallales bacterium]